MSLFFCHFIIAILVQLIFISVRFYLLLINQLKLISVYCQGNISNFRFVSFSTMFIYYLIFISTNTFF